jgi:signal transduction histidine kinase
VTTDMMNSGEAHSSSRQLAHDLRSPLSVISMSLEILPSVRNDEEQFLMLCNMMTNAATELKLKIASLVDPTPAE